MSSLILVTLGLLCTPAGTLEAPNFSREYLEPHQPSVRTMSPNAEGFTYVYCDSAREQYSLECHYRVKTPDGREKHCDLSLPAPEDDNPRYTFRFNRLRRMHGVNIVGFEWALWGIPGREHHAWLSLVDMDTCRLVQLDFPLDAALYSNFHVLAHEDGFHVSLDSRRMCGSRYNPCTLRYNHKGHRVGKPTYFPSRYYERAMVVDRLDSRRGGFFVSYNYSVDPSALMSVSLVRYDGSGMVLIRDHYLKEAYMATYAVQSNEHGYFSLCHPENSERMEVVRCVGSDARGRGMMNMTVTLEEKYQMVRVFNRRRGGVILVFCVSSSLDCVNARVNIRAVDASGRVSVSAKLPGVGLNFFDSRAEGVGIDHSETDDEHCFYFARTRRLWRTGETVFKYVKSCMNKTGDNWAF